MNVIVYSAEMILTYDEINIIKSVGLEPYDLTVNAIEDYYISIHEGPNLDFVNFNIMINHIDKMNRFELNYPDTRERAKQMANTLNQNRLNLFNIYTKLYTYYSGLLYRYFGHQFGRVIGINFSPGVYILELE